MIRIRRCQPKGVLRRPRYQVEFDEAGVTRWQKETTSPVTTIDQHVGVGEAWALVHAADRAWDEGSSQWISLPEPPT